LLFSLMPALHAAREATGAVLQQAGRSGVGGRSRSRDVLVVGQVAAAVLLLVGAGLLLRTFDRLQRLDLGFSPDRLITMRTQLPNPKYTEATMRLAFYERVIDGVLRIPGVERVAYASLLPFMSQGNTTSYNVEGQTSPNGVTDALFRTGSADYLETIGAQLVDGRLLDRRDTRDAPGVVVINETFARLHWPGDRAVGRRVRFGADTEARTVVGVIRDMRERGYVLGAKPAAYAPFAQVLTGWFPDNLVVRSSRDATALAPAIRAVIASIDPEQPIAAVRAVRDLIDLEVVDRRQQTVLLAAFAALAVLLAALGLYGVLAHAVTGRRREIALRMALGASLASVVRAVAIQGQLLVAAGLAVGLAVSLAGAHTLRTLLFGVGTTDPWTFVAAGVLLWMVSILASGIPALRAARVDPALVLRDE
jgi:predicted permease